MPISQISNAVRVMVAAMVLGAGVSTGAERQPVLAQVAVPHPYYYREMYLPRLTSGPSAVAFAPDGLSVVYSMQGRLWIQPLDSTRARQITAGPGYDYQPDWSPDGRRIVFARYLAHAIELAVVDVATGNVSTLTRNGAVNVEPRWSPDGERLAWVSTEETGRFHVFTGRIDGSTLRGARAWPERRSALGRYYYGAVDHELSPDWSPDGTELIYVGNHEIAYGTGSLWRRELRADAEPVLVQREETTWRAGPDWAPDGRRILYSSYAGRQWHQLAVTTPTGADPIALSYGEHDVTAARWSPDGRRIAFISNRNGHTELWLQDAQSGRQWRLGTSEHTALQVMGLLRLHTTDAHGEPVATRVAVRGADGRHYAPAQAWIHADDGYDRHTQAFETHYFHADGDALIEVPAGAVEITVWRGLEHHVEQRRVTVEPGPPLDLSVAMQPLPLPAAWGSRWLSADVHVHMNYGGTYRNTPARMVRQADAEDLDVVFNLIVNKEQRIPDIDYFSTAPDPASTGAVLLSHGQEYHTSYWGHLGLLGLREHFLLPDYSAYAHTALASPYPSNAAVADLARAQGALVGYVHPFDVPVDPDKDATLTHALPIDVALGKVDYYEVVGFSGHQASAGIWHRLLNCGFRVSAAAGTDAMANFASLRGPVGLNRTYVYTDAAADSGADPQTRQDWVLQGLRAGRTLATNGPLIGLTVEGREPGSELIVRAGQRVHYAGFLQSIVPVDHLELVMNGKVVRRIRLQGDRRHAQFAGELDAADGGWLLVRAWSRKAHPLVFDNTVYATTNPVFLVEPGAKRACGADADYFLAWIDRVRAAAAAHSAYNTESERTAVLAEIDAARSVLAQRR